MLNNTFEKTVAFLLFERCTLICCSGVILPMHVYPALLILTVQITYVDFIDKSSEMFVGICQVIWHSCPQLDKLTRKFKEKMFKFFWKK